MLHTGSRWKCPFTPFDGYSNNISIFYKSAATSIGTKKLTWNIHIERSDGNVPHQKEKNLRIAQRREPNQWNFQAQRQHPIPGLQQIINPSRTLESCLHTAIVWADTVDSSLRFHVGEPEITYWIHTVESPSQLCSSAVVTKGLHHYNAAGASSTLSALPTQLGPWLWEADNGAKFSSLFRGIATTGQSIWKIETKLLKRESQGISGSVWNSRTDINP